jgi:hypothetical protein
VSIYCDSSRSGTEGLVGGSGGVIVDESSGKFHFQMKTSTKFTIKLNQDEMVFLRDLVRIGMKSEYYQEYSTEEIDDIECEDIRINQLLAVSQFVNLCPVSNIESLYDANLFKGVTV